MKIRTILFVAFSFLMLASCGEKESVSLSKHTEEISDAVFQSPYFKMTVQKPDGWTALSDAQAEKIMGIGGKIAAHGNSTLEAVVEASEQNSYHLFSFFQYELGSPVEFNPNVTAITENVSAAPGIKSGKDYFFHTKKLMAQANPEYSFSEGYSQREIGGQIFDQMDLIINVAGTSAQQSYYATRYNDFMVIIIESNGLDQDTSDTSAIIDSVEFDW